jgi:hypothetical protein
LITNLKIKTMKNLKFDENAFVGARELSREEMKKLTGGNDFEETIIDWEGGGGGTGDGPKVKACYNKKQGDACAWTYKNRLIQGYCRIYMAQPLHCSELL